MVLSEFDLLGHEFSRSGTMSFHLELKAKKEMLGSISVGFTKEIPFFNDGLVGHGEKPFFSINRINYLHRVDSQGPIRTSNSEMNEGSDVTNVTKGKVAI